MENLLGAARFGQLRVVGRAVDGGGAELLVQHHGQADALADIGEMLHPGHFVLLAQALPVGAGQGFAEQAFFDGGLEFSEVVGFQNTHADARALAWRFQHQW